MNGELRELYQEIILDHNRKPRNFLADPCATHRADGHNPLCGDCVTVFVRVEGDQVAGATFQGTGCAISTASASMMTEAVVGKSVEEAIALTAHVLKVLAGHPHEVIDLGAIEALVGVREFPMRVKCATLAWHALDAALKGAAEPVTTEK